MSDATVPVGFTAERLVQGFLAAALIGSLMLVGVVFVIKPMLVVGLMFGTAFILLALANPRVGLGIFLASLALAPIYFGVQVVPFLPPFPISLLLLAVLTPVALFFSPMPAGRPSRNLITGALAVFGAALTVSIALGGFTSPTFTALIRCFIIPFMAHLITLRLVQTADRVNGVLDVLLVTAVISSVYGLVEFTIGWNPLIENLTAPTGDSTDLLYWQQSSTAAPSGAVYRSFGFELNPLYFGGFVSMLFAYAVTRISDAERRRDQALYAVAAGLCVLGVATTFSRGPILALAVSVIWVSIFVPRFRRIVVVCSIFVLFAGLVALPWIGPPIMERFRDVDNVTLRFKLWETASHMFLDNPITGVGLSRFAEHQLATIREHEVGPFPEYSGGDLENLATADGTFFQLAAEAGLFGVLSFTAVFVIAIWSLLRGIWKSDPGSRQQSVAITAALIAYLVNGLTITAYTAYTMTVTLSVFLALAVIVHARRSTASHAVALRAVPDGA